MDLDLVQKQIDNTAWHLALALTNYFSHAARVGGAPPGLKYSSPIYRQIFFLFSCFVILHQETIVL